jgi:hypothetical protein
MNGSNHVMGGNGDHTMVKARLWWQDDRCGRFGSVSTSAGYSDDCINGDSCSSFSDKLLRAMGVAFAAAELEQVLAIGMACAKFDATLELSVLATVPRHIFKLLSR